MVLKKTIPQVNNIDQNLWINRSHGLALNKGNTDSERDNENGILFLSEFFLIKDILNILTPEDIQTFKSITIDLQAYKDYNRQVEGLYDRGAGESLFAALKGEQDKLRTISHDNLTAISAFSKKYNLPFAKHIARYGLTHFMLFNNRYPDTFKFANPQWHPRDIFFWLWSAGGFYKMLSIPFLPIFIGASIESCFSKFESTSGKLLLFVRLQSDDSFLFKIIRKLCYSLLRRQYGHNWLYEITRIYFFQTDHPIPILAKTIVL